MSTPAYLIFDRQRCRTSGVENGIHLRFERPEEVALQRGDIEILDEYDLTNPGSARALVSDTISNYLLKKMEREREIRLESEALRQNKKRRR